VSIIRDIVEIEETYAKTSIVTRNGLKYVSIFLTILILKIKDGRDAGKDVLEVERLKAQVDGIVLDA
jgi:carboxyl-terminal processing protease